MSASLANKVTEIKKPKPLPAPDSDFYKFAEDLPAEGLAIVKKVRAFMETKVAPIINKYWVENSFPFELLPSYKKLGIAGIGINGYGCPGGSPLLVGLVGMELARTPLVKKVLVLRPPIAELIGFEVDHSGEGRASTLLQAGPQHANPMGTLHGGILCDIADAAMGMALASTLSVDESFTTIDLAINFFRPVWRAQCA
jgi:hypothetical protein